MADALALLESVESDVVENETQLKAMLRAGIDEADKGLTVPWVPGEIWREVERQFEEAESD